MCLLVLIDVGRSNERRGEEMKSDQRKREGMRSEGRRE